MLIYMNSVNLRCRYCLALRITACLLCYVFACFGTAAAQGCSGGPPFACSSPGQDICSGGTWSCSCGATECTLPPSQYVCTGYGWPTCGGNGWYCNNEGTPIIIDVAHNGFHLTSAAAGVRFDFFGNGIPVQMAWTAFDSKDAFLVLDRNHNGQIDDGSELFGNVTHANDANGFLALAEYDKPEHGGNGDGIIDSHDAVYAQLQLWMDDNHDGIVQPSELHSLAEMGIYSLSLTYSESRRIDRFGNQFRYRAAVNPDANGNPMDGRWAYDVILTIAH